MHDPLQARPDDQPLSVYALTEFVFCPRAGLCTYGQYEEFEERDMKPSATYLPIHDQRELELKLKKLTQQFWNVLLGGGMTTLLVGLMAWVSGWILLWGATAGVAAIAGFALVDRILLIVKTLGYLQIWKEAAGRLPDPNSSKIQYVHWCELMAAGFQLTQPQGAYSFEPWKFGGKPWRLLEYGSLRIPVFMHWRPWKDLRPQHFVRIAAYCRLIMLREGFESPCGVIAMPDDYQAIIVPCTPQTQEDFFAALHAARRIIRDYEERNLFPDRPWDEQRCRGCPHGEPIPLRKGDVFSRNHVPLPVCAFKGKDWRKYHSHCGDRFRWTPPHAKTKQLRSRF